MQPDEDPEVEDHSPPLTPRKLRIPERLCQKAQTYSIGEIQENPGEQQLSILIKAKGKDGKPRLLKTLIDTGAEANLIKTGLLPDHVMYRSQ